MLEIDNIYNMDCLEGMKQLADNSVDMVVTSPPYDNLRTYDKDIDKSWGEHVWKPLAEELYRTTKEGGVVVWVVSDATSDGTETGTSFKQALYFMQIGFNLHDTMIYAKNNPCPVGGSNRYFQSFEYMFVFSKGTPHLCTALTEPRRNACNDNRTVRTKALQRNADGSFTKKVVHRNMGDPKRRNMWFYNLGSNENTWHPAVFPIQLAQDHILSWSKEGDTVLDPFMGSATTAVACHKLHRHFIGFELNKEYFDKATARIKREQQQLSLF